MSVTAIQQHGQKVRKNTEVVGNEIVFAAITHIAEAAVVQPDQQLTPASGSEITVSLQ